MKKRTYQIILLLLIIGIISIRLFYQKPNLYRKVDYLLGTYVEVAIYQKPKRARILADSTFNLMRKYEKILSSHIPNSEVYNINHSDRNSIKISSETSDLIRKSEEISKLTSGAFDITVGKICNRCDFVENFYPNQAEIKELLPYVDYRKIRVSNDSLYKESKGIEIDLGGIAKGYIIDKAIEFLRDEEIDKGFINVGGDMFLLDNNNPDKWKIGIQHPRDKGEIFATISVNNKSVVTSGDYERYFIKDGMRYHHIINPKTGMPANDLVSVTVIADKACLADALSTAVFVMGLENGLNLIDSIPDIDAFIIWEKNDKLNYKMSDGFDRYLIDVK
ncbi:MAG: FAD:protein FMN transferase [Candidatus Cloacimonadota bacterium]|nr:MAG: FAD:protein FMN transferase [Candidatus Cloacimonadota bacterium]